MARLLGIDVGGTFTDLFCLDEASGHVQTSKSSTTAGNLSDGLFDAMGSIGLSPADIDYFIHGTTIATNALIERKGARCGMITTAGFRDVIEFGRRDRPHSYGLYGIQQPLIPRDLRFEVIERLDNKGNVVVPLDEDGVRHTGRALKARGAEAVVVCFLHSYANPAHEERAKEILEEIVPDWVVNTSSGLLPEYYEFERFSTATIHTFLQLMVEKYAVALRDRLSDAGYTRDVMFVQSNGGIISSASACTWPANLALSGPAAGVTAASYLAGLAGFENVISADMGGTSFDVCLIPRGRPRTTEETQLDFRLPLRVSMIEVNTVGAGGGSISWIDRSGILRVGPASAGAHPGPVAYGRGGTRPTVTDANLALGRINPNYMLGGESTFRMDVEAARAAIARDVGEALGLPAEEAAMAIIRVANSSMAGRIRLVSIERGYDPRNFAIVAFGGAGPLHGAALMKDVGIGRCLVPYFPGVLCALGSAAADVRHDFVQTVMRSLDEVDFDALAAQVTETVAEAKALIGSEGVAIEQILAVVQADMAYEGQRHDIRVGLPPAIARDTVERAFIEAYTNEYGAPLDGIAMRITTLRVTVIGMRPKLSVGNWVATAGSLDDARTGIRPVYFEDRFYDTPAYERTKLALDTTIEGPAVIEQADTTTLIEPGVVALVDRFGNLIMEGVAS